MIIPLCGYSVDRLWSETGCRRKLRHYFSFARYIWQLYRNHDTSDRLGYVSVHERYVVFHRAQHRQRQRRNRQQPQNERRGCGVEL